jgi:hypothetical protein
MFFVDEEKTIHITRGDMAILSVSAMNADNPYMFREGDVVRLTVCEKKDCSNVVLQKDVTITEECELVEINIESEDTKFGEVINKPVDYWYEIELNPETAPQTIVGYDDNGAKVFKLYPEGVKEV